jgi:pyrroloquinoline quinone biosynthesis protein E
MTEDGLRSSIGKPLWLLAELTYRCPLHCIFCSNPVNYVKNRSELSTAEWVHVLEQARELGSVQLGLSGGEPLIRNDLEEMIATGRRLGYYTNLITSGTGLDERRTTALRRAGLDHVQLSFQDSTRELNDFLSHTKTFDLKAKAARLLKDAGFPIVLNVVIHRQNIDHVEQILEMAEELGADYLELANVQYYGWAFLNRVSLIPRPEQIRAAEAAVNAFRRRTRARIRCFFVLPDYYEKRPKRCVNGWGSTLLVITPDGLALPCHEARMLPGLTFPRVTEHSLQHIWYESEAFSRFRGTAWMKEPCLSCPERLVDLGGCRCQAFLLTGDASNADPVCEFSPHHATIVKELLAAVTRSNKDGYIFRDDRNSRRFAGNAGGPSTRTSNS